MAPGAIEVLEAESRDANARGDPTALLMAEHSWLRSVLVEMKARLQSGTVEDRSALDTYFSQVNRRLELHIRKEEEVFFPALEPLLVEAGQGSTVDMYGEHDAIRIRRDQLLAAFMAGSSFSEEFAAFARSITVHFDNEEELIFADAPNRLTAEQGLQLVAGMQVLQD